MNPRRLILFYPIFPVCLHLTLNQTCVQLRLSLKEEDVDLLEELFVQEGIFDPNSVADFDSSCWDTASEEISLLMQAVEELKETVEEVAPKRPNLHSVRYCCS